MQRATGYGPAMDEVSVDALRSRLSDYIAEVESGAIYVILRHGQPVAVLAPATPELGGRPLGVSRFRATLRRSIRRAAQEPVRLTYRGRTVAHLGPFSERAEALWRELP